MVDYITIPTIIMKAIFLTLLLFSIMTQTTYAITPTAAIDIYTNNSNNNNNNVYYTLLASQGNFAPYLPMNSQNSNIDNDNTNKYNNMIPMFPPTNDELLCSDVHVSSLDFSSWKTNNNNDNDKPFVFVVPRGSCTFQHKALIAQLYGASGIIIYGSLSSRYGYNETSSSIIYPLQYHDYDCSISKGGGKSLIPIDKLIDFNDDNDNTKPYNSENNGLLSGSKVDGNLCAIYSENDDLFEQNCSSQKCVLTGNRTSIESSKNGGGSSEAMEACCAWDTHIFLYHDDSMIDNTTGQEYQPITIPAFYITMEEADHLLASMQSGSVTVTMYTRWYPKYNVSTILIWALGVFVAAVASYLSASEIRDARNDIEKKLNLTDSNDDSNSNGEESAISMKGGYQRVSGDGRDCRAIAPEEVLELDASHAIFFIIFSSAGLLILFFFKIYNVVKVFYAFSCSSAIMQVIVIPFYFNVAKKLGVRDRVAFSTQVADIGSVTVIDVLSIVTAYGLGAVWIYMAFTYRHPDTIPFFWIMQDIMGACMCILFLQTMKLNSIKVASILLTAAFFYDIFFVFVTPYLTKGGKSIMVDVATSGGPPTGDPNWCEKYPEGPECQGGDPLPMLFTIPRLFDYMGGSSMLGLGDIVLPGLLLSFASRYDEAKRLIGAFHSSPRSTRQTQECSRNMGYFIPSVIAYGIGLAMANIAVHVMQMGQPALLYLVPCCLGIILYLGRKRNELSELWNTPKVLASCDKILYGSEEEENSSAMSNSGDE